MENTVELEEQTEEESFNPQLTDELNEGDVEKIKGDAIGDTLYSERFVLSTILKLPNLEEELSENEDLEKDLCNLWDTTIEKDVVELLLSHSVMELFSNIIQNSSDNRLIEILIGIIGNMCSLKATRDFLCDNPEITRPIIQTIGCYDSLTLIQLMRFFQAISVFENNGDEVNWFQHFAQIDQFVDDFAFILSNSCNLNLLVNALEAINALCTKFSVLEIQSDETKTTFQSFFVKQVLIAGMNDAFNQLLFPEATKTQEEKEDGEGEEEMEKICSKKRNKVMSLFLDTHVILSQFEDHSIEQYQEDLPEVLNCISKILSPLCSSINLIPLTSSTSQTIENVTEIFESLGDIFHPGCFVRMLKIWSIIENECLTSASKSPSAQWNEDSNDAISGEELSMSVIDFVIRNAENATQEAFDEAIKELDVKIVTQLHKILNQGEGSGIASCCDKVKSSLKSIWNIEVTDEQNGDNNSEEDSVILLE